MKMTIQELKQKQLETILTYNPMLDDYHNSIRTVSDIHTFQELYDEEILNGSTYDEFDLVVYDEPKSLYVPDIEEILKKGTITVYSSYPIKQGVFVTPSKVEARSYSGGKPIHFRRVRLTDVAWIDFNEGQYAKVK